MCGIPPVVSRIWAVSWPAAGPRDSAGRLARAGEALPATAAIAAMTASIRNLITASSSFSRSVTPVTPGTPPTLGVTRPARHRPSGHKLSRPPMPQGLPAHRPPAYPGPARQEASTKATGHVPHHPQAQKTPGPARPRQPARYGAARTAAAPEQPAAAKPGPPHSQRHHQRAGRLQQELHDSPKLAILREPRFHRPAPQARRIRRSAARSHTFPSRAVICTTWRVTGQLIGLPHESWLRVVAVGGWR